jgi:hypothetical protein
MLNQELIMLMGLAGCILLILGRKLFWLFVALVGMVSGMQAAEQYFGTQPYWVFLFVGLLAAAIGALLAIFFQRIAIALAGLLVGSTISAQLGSMLGWPPLPLLNFAGGIIGAVVLFWLFDWGLIVLSSIVGAGLIVHALNDPPQIGMPLYLGLAIIGIAIQTALKKRTGVRPPMSR